jgi:hypothetical protein
LMSLRQQGNVGMPTDIALTGPKNIDLMPAPKWRRIGTPVAG